MDTTVNQAAVNASDNSVGWPRFLTLPVAVAAGLLLRVLLIGSKSIWLDEMMSLYVTRSGPAAWLTGTVEGYHPPLYYAFLSLWVQLGQSEGILRLSSALFGVLAIPLTYTLARGLASKGVSLAAAWLVALSPLLVWYSQEFRSYSLLVFLVLLAALAFVRLLTAPQRAARVGWWLLYVAAMAAGFYTHYNMLLSLPIQFALLLVLAAQGRIRRVGVIAALLAWPAIVAAYWPWLSSPPAVNFLSFATTSGGYPGLLVQERFGITWPVAVRLALALGAVAVALFVVVWDQARRRNLWPAIHRSPALRLALLILFVAFLVASVYPRAYSVKRLLVVFVPFLCLLIAWFWPMRPRLYGPLPVLLALSLIASLVNVIAVPKDDWRSAAGYVESRTQPGDAILVAPGYDNLPFAFYHRGRLPVTEIGRPEVVNADALAGSGGRVWLVYNDLPGNAQTDGARLAARLGERMGRAEEWNGYRVRAVLFTAR